jgi:hypothetical protein
MAAGCLTRKSLAFDLDNDLPGRLIDTDAHPVAIRAIGILLDRGHHNASCFLGRT